VLFGIRSMDLHSTYDCCMKAADQSFFESPQIHQSSFSQIQLRPGGRQERLNVQEV